MIDSISLKKVFQNLRNEEIEPFTLEVFNFQAKRNPVYKQYLSELGIKPDQVLSVSQIPFLPIEFFKSHKVVSNDFEADVTFTSSGTTGQIPSRHFVKETSYYHQNCTKIFNQYFGQLDNYVILALLPSYLERSDSSLISMIDHFIKLSDARSGFFLYNYDKLLESLSSITDKKVMIWGVTFALLDLAEKYAPDLSESIIVETGGMKGRRAELTKSELYDTFRQSFNTDDIYTEYGMTELLSQGYGKNGKISLPIWMRALIREINDPFSYELPNRAGGVNMIDLANIDSCSFIETKDIGRIDPDGYLEVLGRFDNSEIRGCNLMVS